jgi:TetR/AcrR family transcriptional repressor of bet genes
MGRKSNADQRRAEIVQALYECLAEQGHEKVTIKVIAARAGLPPGVIHYYFNSKEDIIADLARFLVNRYSQKLEDRLAGARSHRQGIAIVVDYVVDELVFDAALNRVFFNLTQMAFERESLHAVMREMFRIYRRRMVDVLTAAGMGERSASIGARVVALAEGFSLQWMIEPGVFTPKDVKDALTQAVGPIPGD